MTVIGTDTNWRIRCDWCGKFRKWQDVECVEVPPVLYVTGYYDGPVIEHQCNKCIKELTELTKGLQVRK